MLEVSNQRDEYAADYKSLFRSLEIVWRVEGMVLVARGVGKLLAAGGDVASETRWGWTDGLIINWCD